MERMLPKMYKDLFGIVSVLCMGLFPHQVVTEESLCYLDFRPQPYSLEEEVGSIVWESPKVPLQWKVDLNETNDGRSFCTGSRKEHRRAANRPCTFRRYLGTSAREKPKHQRVRDIPKSSNCPRWIGEPLRLQLRQYALEAKVLRQLLERVELSGSRRRRQLGKKRRLPGKKRKGTVEQSKQNRLKNEKRSLKKPFEDASSKEA